jgi:hypothetical protein
MTTNETLLLVVTAIAALVLLGMFAGVVYQSHSRKRGVIGGSIRPEIAADAPLSPSSFVTQLQQPVSSPPPG